MKVLASGSHTVPVNITVNVDQILGQVMDQTIGSFNWTKEEDGRYLIMEEQSAGCHSFDIEVKEITKTEFDFIENVKAVRKYIKDEERTQFKVKK